MVVLRCTCVAQRVRILRARHALDPLREHLHRAPQVLRRLQDERPAEVDERMKELLLRRNASQPVTQRSVGCIFKNPEEEAAGALIQAAGLMGERVGDIEVSTKHANYFVNTGHGTARQLLDLVERVQERVRDHAGVELELEVQLWGF